jgi:hypothetical protein
LKEDAVALEKLYSVIKKRCLEEGNAYVITGGKHLVEALIYYEVIIHIKSRTLSHEQIVDALMNNDIREVNASSADVKPEDVQPLTIEQTFPAAAPFILSVDDTVIRRILHILKLMGQLSKLGPEGYAAFDVIADSILKKYPGFSLESSTVKKRIDEFSNEFLIAFPFINGESIPSDRRLVPEWVFNRIVMPESLFKEIFLYFIFFGDLCEQIFKTIVKKESGFGAKVGVARMSKVVYSAACDGKTVTVYKGATKAGELLLNCHAEKKTGILLTQADLDKFNIKDGDTVSLTFKKK